MDRPAATSTTESPAVNSVVIVGGGLAGLSTAQELRRRSFAGSVTIVDREGFPYDRPPLSKAYLHPGATAASLALVDQTWYAENDVHVLHADVDAIDPGDTRVNLQSGRTLGADRIVLATGGRPRPLGVPGSDHPEIHYLRSRSDADRIRKYLGPGRRVLIAGAGLIGAELASTAVAQGTDIIVVDPAPIPLAPAVGEELAVLLHSMHSEAGVQCVHGSVSSVERSEMTWVATVHRGPTLDDLNVKCDAIVVAIGILPDTELAQRAGLEVNGGVIVNDLHQTSSPTIFAVGDAARHKAADGTLAKSHEHWESAATDGRRAAAAIQGETPDPPGAPWFWSDRYGVHVEVVGSMTGPGHTVVRQPGQAVGRSESSAPWAAFRVQDSTLLGCATVDDAMSVRAARRIIERGIHVDIEALASATATDLRRLAR